MTPGEFLFPYLTVPPQSRLGNYVEVKKGLAGPELTSISRPEGDGVAMCQELLDLSKMTELPNIAGPHWPRLIELHKEKVSARAMSSVGTEVEESMTRLNKTGRAVREALNSSTPLVVKLIELAAFTDVEHEALVIAPAVISRPLRNLWAGLFYVARRVCTYYVARRSVLCCT